MVAARLHASGMLQSVKIVTNVMLSDPLFVGLIFVKTDRGVGSHNAKPVLIDEQDGLPILIVLVMT